jgi:DNA-binding transcriptional regulator YiaG
MNYDLLIEEMAAYMKRHKMNQTTFAQVMGVSPSAVSYWFSGRRKPNITNFLSFLKLLEAEKNGTD